MSRRAATGTKKHGVQRAKADMRRRGERGRRGEGPHAKRGASRGGSALVRRGGAEERSDERPPETMSRSLSHLDRRGRARMVEVGEKPETAREAVASGVVRMQAATLRAILSGGVPKGDVLAVARVAAIQGLKRTPELIPLCHPVRVTGVEVDLVPDAPRAQVCIRVRVRAHDRTGVEMEALTAVAIAALTVYDMCKAIDRGMQIADIQLEEKRGGKSGVWQR